MSLASAPFSGPQQVNIVPIRSGLVNSLLNLEEDAEVELGNGMKVRGWKGEGGVDRYMIGQIKNRPGNWALVPVPPDKEYEGPTFVICFPEEVGNNPLPASGIPAVQRRVRSFFGDWGKIGIAALLTLDVLGGIYLYKNSNKGSNNAPALVESGEKEKPAIAEVSEVVENGKMILKEQRSIQYILNNADISLAELVVGNPNIVDAVRGKSWSDIRQIVFPSGSSFNIQKSTPLSAPADNAEFVGPPLISLEDFSQTPEIEHRIDQYHTMLEMMIASECKQIDGVIPKDDVGGADVHKGEQYAGINMNAAMNSNDPLRISRAQEIAACHARGDQKNLRKLVKTYYLTYYFPENIPSKNTAITGLLLDISMNRGRNSLQPMCQMVMNDLADTKFPVSHGFKKAKDKEGNEFDLHNWDTTWTQEMSDIWQALCLLYPEKILDTLQGARQTYEDHTHGPRPSVRPGLADNRWPRSLAVAKEMLLPATYRYLGYYECVALIKASISGESVPTHDVTGKPIIYRVERIANPTEKQLPAEQIFTHLINRDRPEKKMILVHGTASGVVGVDIDDEKRDLGGYNAVYRSSDAAYIITSRGLIFQFFDPTKGHGAANATHIATSTGTSKGAFNFNDACVAIELCLRGYAKDDPSPDAIYGVEPPSSEQKEAVRQLVIYLKEKLGIKYAGTSADPVRDRKTCSRPDGRIMIGKKFLVPGAHCDDFSPVDRLAMNLDTAEKMGSIFGDLEKLGETFGVDSNLLEPQVATNSLDQENPPEQVEQK